MARRKENIKSVAVWGIVSTLIIAACLLVSVSLAQAETMKYRVNAYITQMETIPVGDVEGHVVAVYSRKGLAFFENGEVATYSAWLTLDAIKMKGSYQGYSQLTYEDGSTAVQKLQGTSEPAPDRKIALVKFTGEYTQGTGRFQGIKGTFSATGKLLTPYSKETKSDVYFDVTATYTLPPKK